MLCDKTSFAMLEDDLYVSPASPTVIKQETQNRQSRVLHTEREKIKFHGDISITHHLSEGKTATWYQICTLIIPTGHYSRLNCDDCCYSVSFSAMASSNMLLSLLYVTAVLHFSTCDVEQFCQGGNQ